MSAVGFEEKEVPAAPAPRELWRSERLGNAGREPCSIIAA